MKIVKNFYNNRFNVLMAIMKDAKYAWKSDFGNQALNEVPQGFDSMSTTKPPLGVNDYHLNKGIQELAALVEQETNQVIVNAWGNIHKSNKWLGAHIHSHNPMIKSVATYIIQAPLNETITFADQDVLVETNMLLIFDSSLMHGIKSIDRKSDLMSITFELTDI
jgi:hypothetical protein